MKYLLLILAAGVCLFPVYWMALGSVQESAVIMSLPPQVFPHFGTWENYELILEDARLVLWVSNTVSLVSLAVVCGVLTTMMAAYAMARYEFVGKALVFHLLVAGLVIPGAMLFVPRFVIVERLGLWGSRLGVLLAYPFNPMHIVIARNYIKGIPEALAESARIDGAGEWLILIRIILPLCRPILGAIAVWNAITAMSDFLWQYLVLMDPEKHTLLVGLINATMRDINKYLYYTNPIGMRLAAGTILFVPLILMFAFFQRYFRGGLTVGALKA